MTHRHIALIVAVLVVSSLVGCSESVRAPTPTPPGAVSSGEPSKNMPGAPSVTSAVPALTAASATAVSTPAVGPGDVAPLADGPTIRVPAGARPSIDGVLDPREWGGAYQDELSDGSELYLMQDGEYLYLGIRYGGGGSGVGSLCAVRGDTVAVLHSSAALGTAVYESDEGGWRQTQGFTWRCRTASDAPFAQEERDRFLQEEGWLANNGRMGTPGELEYQIAMPDGSLRVAVSFIGPPDFESVAHWPMELSDDCGSAQMLQGPIPERARLNPESWITVTPVEPPMSDHPGSTPTSADLQSG